MTELPSVFIGEFFISRWGRRWPQIGFVLAATILYACNTILGGLEGYGTAITALAICSKVMSSVSFFIMWVQAVEIYPTCIRVSGTNMAAMVGAIIVTAAPYVILLVSF